MLKGIYGVLIGLLIILLVMFGRLVINSDIKAEEQVSVKDPEYHIQFIIHNKNESYWNQLEEGAKQAEDELGVYVEFVTLEQMDTDSLREAVEMGANAGVDGIALQAADSEQTQFIMNEVKNQGVAVITYENYDYNFIGIPSVGTNNYSLGNYAGKMAIEASGGKANVAVVINSTDNEGIEQYKNLVIEGINNAFEPYSTMKISDANIYTIDTEMFEAEKIATAIMKSEDTTDLIICMNEKCTPGIAQILVDNNKVGDIKLVGTGITAQTLDYIERGVIYGTVCPDAYEIGYDTVKSLVQILKGEQISDTISTDLFTIDKSNVSEYKENSIIK